MGVLYREVGSVGSAPDVLARLRQVAADQNCSKRPKHSKLHEIERKKEQNYKRRSVIIIASLVYLFDCVSMFPLSATVGAAVALLNAVPYRRA
jgi:hypothetical protein